VIKHRIRDGMGMRGGMVLLALDQRLDPYDEKPVYERLPLAGLVRLAEFLGCNPVGPFVSEGAHRHALIRAITRREAVIARGPKSKRWER